jgi:hypothetical protein
VDNSGGMLFPLYDEGCNLVYLVGKGDLMTRFYEVRVRVEALLRGKGKGGSASTR